MISKEKTGALMTILEYKKRRNVPAFVQFVGKVTIFIWIVFLVWAIRN